MTNTEITTDILFAILAYLFYATGPRTNIKSIGLYIQSFMLILKIISAYSKTVNGKQMSFNRLLLSSIHHYLKTHPEGQSLAKRSAIMPKVDQLAKNKDIGVESIG